VVYRLFCELSGYDPEKAILCTPKMALATFNPIYLWGPPGSGKTHLLVALAHAFQQRGLTALYARAETFMEHVVTAIRSSEMQAFRKAYRNVDILLIDDVHVFARKNATQEEFFHTFNTLQTSTRQIILSSKCAPTHLEEIEPRLVSRFEWGINLHFEKLESSDLKRVLQKQSQARGFPLSGEVCDFLVQAFPCSTSMQQALDAMILRCHLEQDARYKRNSLLIDKDFAQKMLGDLLEHARHQVLKPDKIISAVSAVCGIRKEDLLGRSQSQEFSLPRQIAMYLCRQKLNTPYQGIGQIFGRDHSTVMTAIRQIEKKVGGGDRELQAVLHEIQHKMEG
jgi:chromosomal replication initiator protein